MLFWSLAVLAVMLLASPVFLKLFNKKKIINNAKLLKAGSGTQAATATARPAQRLNEFHPNGIQPPVHPAESARPPGAHNDPIQEGTGPEDSRRQQAQPPGHPAAETSPQDGPQDGRDDFVPGLAEFGADAGGSPVPVAAEAANSQHPVSAAPAASEGRAEAAPSLVTGAFQARMDAAGAALSGGDITEAMHQWSLARELPDADVLAWLHAANHADPDQRFTLLRDAAARFPLSPDAHRELAVAAQLRSDLPTAEQAWRDFVALAPELWWGYTELAQTLRRQGRENEADTLLRDARSRLPAEPDLVIHCARDAEIRDDWQNAVALWEQVFATWPDRWEGVIGRAIALLRLGRDEEGQAAARLAVQAPPERPELFEYLARSAERNLDWPQAMRWWRRLADLRPDLWWPHERLAGALQQQGKSAEAEAVIENSLAQFPAEPGLAAQYARLADAKGDGETASQRWDAVIERFQNVWAGYRGKAVHLMSSGNHSAADALIEANAPRFPDDLDAIHDAADLAERKQNWPAAEAGWHAILARHSEIGWAHLRLIRTLSAQGKHNAAESAAESAIKTLPLDSGIMGEAARLSETQGDWPRAAERWRAFSRLRPNAVEGPVGEAKALQQQGDFAAADQVIVDAMPRVPDNAALHEAYALNALKQENWDLALARLQAAQAAVPGNEIFRQKIIELQRGASLPVT